MDEYQRTLDRARSGVNEVTGEQVESAVASGALLVDIREPRELATGMIPGAVAIPMGALVARMADNAPDRDRPIILYCAVGQRSLIAAAALTDHGYTRVSSLAGGTKLWQLEERPWTVAGTLRPDQRLRYSRHIMLPDVGIAGQETLLDSRVVVIGAGGLGSPAALYLAAAGVGTLGIVDFDRVETSNLQRQILHNSQRVGHSKTESASLTIEALNPDVTVVAHDTRLDAGNAIDILGGYDIIVDGSDNFATRYLVNDGSLHLRIPVVHGSIFRYEGQVSVFEPYSGPCYRCLFPTPPPPELAPNCAEAGVFGVLPGVIGSMQAAEALKLLLGIGRPLTGRLLTYDALEQTTLVLKLERDPRCPACSDESSPPDLSDGELYC